MAKTITGTLHYLDTGQLVSDWGAGNFLALKFTNNKPDEVKTIKVGLDPSQSSGLVPLDEDMNGVFKITNKDTQKFVIECYNEDNQKISRDEYNLSGLVCEAPVVPTITITSADPIEVEVGLNEFADYEVTNFDTETMEIAFESSDKNVFTVEPWSEGRINLNAMGSDGDTATLTASIKDKTTHEVIASDTHEVLLIPEHVDPYFEFESEDISDNETYAYNYCENGVEAHIVGYGGAYFENIDNVIITTTPANTPLTITKEFVNPETADNVLITISGVNNTANNITVEIGMDQGGVVTFATFTIEGQPAQPEFHSNDFENGGLYTSGFFSTGKDFTIENVEAGDTIALTFDHTSAMPMLTGSISGTTYSGRINGPNVSDNILAASITVNGKSVCDFTIYASNGISISENEIDVNETKDITVSLTKELPTNFIITATPSGGTITVDSVDQTNRKITISGVSSGNGSLIIALEDTDKNNFEFASNQLVVYTNPVGSTATPTDDVQTLLNCAGIYNKDSYTTISDVISDTDTLSAVIANHNAIDYLVRSTTFASAVTADQTAMTDIGADNYASDTLLADSTWLNAIRGSSYSSSVLNSIVPQMTSNTTPSGVVTVSGTYGGNWKSYGAFNDSYEWYGTTNNNQFVQYEFPEAMTLKAFEYQPSTNSSYAAAGYTITLTGSNDGTNFTQLATHSGIKGLYGHALPENKTAYKYYKMHILCENPGQYSICPNAHKIQYYGRKDV